MPSTRTIHVNTREHRIRDEEVERLLALGAALVADHRPDGTGWAVLAEPEGQRAVRGAQRAAEWAAGADVSGCPW